MDTLDQPELGSPNFTECYLEASTPAGSRHFFASNDLVALGGIRATFEASNPSAHFRMAFLFEEGRPYLIEHDAGQQIAAVPINPEQFGDFRRMALAA